MSIFKKRKEVCNELSQAEHEAYWLNKELVKINEVEKGEFFSFIPDVDSNVPIDNFLNNLSIDGYKLFTYTYIHDESYLHGDDQVHNASRFLITIKRY